MDVTPVRAMGAAASVEPRAQADIPSMRKYLFSHWGTIF
jgi:hypothetical protein